MQTQKKRSFFRRLMGFETEEMPQEEMNYLPHEESRDGIYEERGGQYESYESPANDQGYSRGESTINPSYTQSPEQSTPVATTSPKNTPSGEEESWVADQEGQLTIDVYQTESDIVIKSTIAGVRPEDLDIQINNDMVTIRGERRKEEETRDEDYYYQECYWGAFSRSIILPVDIQANKAEAVMKNGILTIRLPKAETAKARKIQVRGY